MPMAMGTLKMYTATSGGGSENDGGSDGEWRWQRPVVVTVLVLL